MSPPHANTSSAPHHASLALPKCSRRAESLGTENAFVVLAEVNALIRQGKDIVSFCIGQPDFPTPDNVQEAAIAARVLRCVVYSAAIHARGRALRALASPRSHGRPRGQRSGRTVL